MATSRTSGVVISSMPYLDRIDLDTAFPVILGGSNFQMTLQVLQGLVTQQSIGLGNVANLAPIDYPVSTAQQRAIDLKANIDHRHTIQEIDGLETALAGKADLVHRHVISDVDGLVQEIQNINFRISNDRIAASRIDGLDDQIRVVVAADPTLKPTVVSGVHSW